MAKTTTFDERVGQIVRRHKALSRGAVAQIGPDGLLTVRPRRTTLRFPWRGLALALILVILGKAALFAYMGADAYGDKLAALEHGSRGERAGAWIMAPDFATERLAEYLAPLF